MRLLVVGQYFWPEAFRINDLVRALEQAGCDVTVLTAQPNYPGGVVFDGYSAASMRTEKFAERTVIRRVPIIPRGSGSAVRLFANYMSFVGSAIVFGGWMLRKSSFDVIFVYAPSPIVQAIPAIFFKRLKGAPVVTWVQDLWPETLSDTGYIRNRFALGVVERLVRWIYTRSDLVLGQSPAAVTALRALSGNTPVDYFPNPGDADAADEKSASPALVLPDAFNVVFAGNLGTVQALDTVLDAAELVQSDGDIHFILIGSGARVKWLESEIARRGLKNVVLPGRFGVHEMPGIFAQASCLLVSLARSSIMSQTIPAKVQAYLAAGRPIIAALDGEGSSVVLEAGAGFHAPAQDAHALADAVVRMKALSAAERKRMGDSGRTFYMEHFDPRHLAEKLVGMLRQLPGAAKPLEFSPDAT